MPTRSATGIKIGMVTAAWPLPEVTNRFTMICMRNIAGACMIGGTYARPFARAFTTVSITFPADKIPEIA